MGMRSIRFSLHHTDVFKQQLRAILRAGDGAVLRIMFPMITAVGEFIAARAIVDQCIEELAGEGCAHNNAPKIGMMVEVPSVVDLIEEFSKHADFFSIGTNDFIQFMLGVDRTNEHVADFYLPYHPAIMRAIAKVGRVGAACGKEVSVCGDMAHEERYVPFLLGVGIRTLSVDAAYVPRLQEALSRLTIAEAEQCAARVMAAGRASDVAAILGVTDESLYD